MGGGYNFNCQCRFKYNATKKNCSILEVSLINNNKISDLLLFVEFSLSMHSIETLVSNYIHIVYDFNHGHQQLGGYSRRSSPWEKSLYVFLSP